MSTISNNRKCWVDVSRGIAILLMVIGHGNIPSVILSFIFAFHMPFFFILSGMLTNYEGKTWEEFIYKKTKSLIPQFFLYSLIVFSLRALIYGDLSIIDLLINGWGMKNALWFVPIFFITSICCFITRKYFNSFFQGCIIILLVILTLLLADSTCLSQWSLFAVPLCMLFMLSGNIFKKYILGFVRNSNLVVLIILFSVTLIGSFFFRLDIASRFFLPLAPIYIDALSGSVLLFIIGMLLSLKSKIITRFFSFWGRDTFLVMGLSQIVLSLWHLVDISPFTRYVLLFVSLYLIIRFKNICIVKMKQLKANITA